MKNYKIIVVVFAALFIQCQSSKKTADSKSKPMDIYLLIGQSNMAGRAPLTELDKDSLQSVFLFTGNDQKPWEKAANPLNKYSTIRKGLEMQKVGPGYSFGKAMSESNPNVKIGLVVNAKGGSSIEEWKPGGIFYNEALSQAKKALKNGVLKGIVWHQGETNQSKYSEYMPKIIELIAALRKDLNKPTIPFIAGQLSSDDPERIPFNAMILGLPAKVKNTGVITTENTVTIDKTHFDSASQNILGKRYAQKMLELQKK